MAANYTRHAQAIERARQLAGPNGVPPLGRWGTNHTRVTPDAEYWAGRLKRDRPEFAERFARGEFGSLKEALRAAKLIRPD